MMRESFTQGPYPESRLLPVVQSKVSKVSLKNQHLDP